MSFAQQLEKRDFEKGIKSSHQEVWQAAYCRLVAGVTVTSLRSAAVVCCSG